MANIQIIQGDFKKKLKLPIAEGLKAGFPSPAEDYSHETLDFNRDLIRNPFSWTWKAQRRSVRTLTNANAVSISIFATALGTQMSIAPTTTSP